MALWMLAARIWWFSSVFQMPFEHIALRVPSGAREGVLWSVSQMSTMPFEHITIRGASGKGAIEWIGMSPI
jgi:hypothetical protein